MAIERGEVEARLLEAERSVRDREYQEQRRRHREAANRAVANAVGQVASTLAASYVFHPDARVAGAGVAKWTAVAMMTPLLATGVVTLSDLVPADGGE